MDSAFQEEEKNIIDVIGYNKLILIITVTFFIISIIISIIYVYIPAAEIEEQVEVRSQEAKERIAKNEAKFNKIVGYIDKMEPEVDRILLDINNAFTDACDDPTWKGILKNTCKRRP